MAVINQKSIRLESRRIGSVNKGILIREIVKKSETTMVSIKKYIKYKRVDINEFKNKMQTLIDEERIDSSCKYEDRKWFGLYIYHNKFFDFSDFEYDFDLYNALKCYVITCLHDVRLSILVVSLRLQEIKKTIRMTKGFNINYIEEFEKYIDNTTETSLGDFKFGNTGFLYFYPMASYIEYLRLLSYIKAEHNLGENVRQIPPYKDIVWFDYHINDFMNNADDGLRAKYFPIYLWWRISTVIPMRPNDFIRLSRNCCYLNQADNEYYIKVPRSKKAPNPLSKRRVIPLIQELKTNKEIYEIIQIYLKMLKIDHSEKFLLSLKAYSDIFFYDSHVIKDRISYQNLCNLLSYFYKEVIKGIYGFNTLECREELNEENQYNSVIKLKLGDTRHLAFCSMMLQGFNPLTIAQIGGHESLDAQSHYCSHLDEFIGSHSLMLAKYIKGNIYKTKDSINDLFTSDEKKELTFRQFDNPNPRRIDGGDCYSKNFPYDCGDKDCIFCSHHKLEFDKIDDMTYGELNESLSITRNDIKTKLDFLKRYYVDICKDGSIDLINLKCSDFAEQELNKQSKQLRLLVNREATILACLEKIKEMKGE